MAKLTDNLVAYWKLDEASGNALDSVGSNTLTANGTGGIGSLSGKILTARDLERSDLDYFSIADNTDLSTGDIDFTLQAWVYIEAKGAAAGQHVCIGKWGSTGGQEYILIYDVGTDRFYFVVSATGTGMVNACANSFGAVAINTWYLVHAWHDSVNNLIGIAVNAGTADTTSHSTGIYNGTNSFIIGRNQDATASPPGDYYHDGLIDEVALWKRVLTSAERTALYNGGIGLTYPFTLDQSGLDFGDSAGAFVSFTKSATFGLDYGNSAGVYVAFPDVVDVSMSGTITAVSTAGTPIMDRQSGMSGTVTSQSTVAAAMDRQPAFSGTVVAVSTVAGSLTFIIDVHGDITALSTAVGILEVIRDVAGTVVGTSTVNADLTVDLAGMSGSIAASGSVSGNLNVDWGLAGAVVGSSSAGTAALDRQQSLAGQVIAVSVVAGVCAVDRDLSGSISGVSTISSVMVVDIGLAGSVTGVSGVSALLSQTLGLSGSIDALASVTGTVSVDRALSAVIAASSSCDAALRVDREIHGDIAAYSTVQGILKFAFARGPYYVSEFGVFTPGYMAAQVAYPDVESDAFFPVGPAEIYNPVGLTDVIIHLEQ